MAWSRNTVVEIVGTSGIGKTTLAHHLREQLKPAHVMLKPDIEMLLESEAFDLDRNSEYFDEHYGALWALANSHQMGRELDEATISRLLKWQFQVIRLEDFLRRHYFPEAVIVLDDGFFQAFSEPILSICRSNPETMSQLVRGRALLFLTASPGRITRQILARRKKRQGPIFFENRSSRWVRKNAIMSQTARLELYEELANGTGQSYSLERVNSRFGRRKATRFVRAFSRVQGTL